MDKNENRAVDGNDGAARDYELAGSGSDSSDNFESSNMQRDGVGIAIAQATTKHVSVAADFLQKLQPRGPWLLTAIDPDPPPPPPGTKRKDNIETQPVSTVEEIDEFVAKWNGKWNLYYSVNPTRGTPQKKAAKHEIAAIRYVYADCDPHEGETREATAARYETARKSAGLPKPTLHVNSGNGDHFLWRLDNPILLPPVESGGLSDAAKVVVGDVEARIGALLLALGTKSATQDICRILHLPGTINLPNAKKRREGRGTCHATFIESNDSVHPLSIFPLPAPDTGKRGGGARAAARPTATTRGGAASKTGKTFPLGVAQLKVLPRIKEMIATGIDPKEADLPPDQRRSRSEYVFAVLTALVRAGHKSDEYECFFLDPDYPITAHVREQSNPRKYFEKNVENAERAVAKDRAEGVEADMAEAVAKLNEDHCVVSWGGSGVVEPTRDADARAV